MVDLLDPFLRLPFGWRLLLHDHGWLLADERQVIRLEAQWPTWGTFNSREAK